jgi:hypothetical protein
VDVEAEWLRSWMKELRNRAKTISRDVRALMLCSCFFLGYPSILFW